MLSLEGNAHMKINSSEQLKVNDDQSERISIGIDGMTCGSCVRNVEKALRNVAGVRSASVDLAKKRAAVLVRSGTTPQLLIKAVEALGFGAELSPNAIHHTSKVEPRSDSCCCGPQ